MRRYPKIRSIIPGRRFCGLLLFSAALFLASCQYKFLNKKPDASLLVPSTLKDFQSLLDFENVMNTAPSLNVIASDDFYITPEGLAALHAQYEKNTYTWEQDQFAGNTILDWNAPYQQVFYSNVVLEGLAALKPAAADQADYDRVKGSALFYRGLAFYELAQNFALPYDPANAGHDLGIPLRLSADVNIKSTRGTLQQTYDQLTGDLEAAAALLPEHSVYPIRPTRQVANGVLARIFLSMGDYDKAKGYADQCINAGGALLDYNTIATGKSNPFPLGDSSPGGNPENLFFVKLTSTFYFLSTLTSVVPDLYASYQDNDLRKTLFFTANGKGGYRLTGKYTGFSAWYGGLATDEVYLIRAECLARAGNTNAAMEDLNLLLRNRMKQGTYTSLTAANGADALEQVLRERRKELLGRGLRWGDLKRLNNDPKYAVTLRRTVGDQQYSLPPNDPKYVFPIPDDEIRNSGIQQNPR